MTSISGAVEAVATLLLDVVYPRRCARCGARGVWLCERCEEDLACFGPPLCGFCGIPQSLGACRCDALPDAVDRVRSLGPFDGWLRGAIVQVKYQGEWARVRHLAPMLASVCEDLLPADALVPVPLHPSRMKHRGFNQSAKIAEALSSEIDVPVLHALRRTRRTTSQVTLDAARRTVNVAGAFALAPDVAVQGMRLVLVDDVITTGSTLGACAEVLRQAGAGPVTVVTVARDL